MMVFNHYTTTYPKFDHIGHVYYSNRIVVCFFMFMVFWHLFIFYYFAISWSIFVMEHLQNCSCLFQFLLSFKLFLVFLCIFMHIRWLYPILIKRVFNYISFVIRTMVINENDVPIAFFFWSMFYKCCIMCLNYSFLTNH